MKTKVKVLITGLIIVGSGAFLLINASKMDWSFDPQKYAGFFNQTEDGDAYNSITGDGDDSDLADKEEKDKEKNQSDDNQQKTEDENDSHHMQVASTDQSGLNYATGEGDNQNDNNHSWGIGDGETGENGNGTGPSGDNNGSAENGGSGENNGGNSGGNTTPDTPSQPTWQESQKELDAPIVTADGTLKDMSVYYPISEDNTWTFCINEAFDPDSVRVYAFFEQDGKTEQKLLSYGGSEGYSININTQTRGNKTAVFSYKGMTMRINYTVINPQVVVGYYGLYNGTEYAYAYPGALPGLEDANLIQGMTSSCKVGANGSLNADLMAFHRNMIALLGTESVQNSFKTADGYKYTVFLEKDSDGYLKTMATGFCRLDSGKGYLDLNGTTPIARVNYPLDPGWKSIEQRVTEVIAPVPEDMKIRWEISEGSEGDWKNYRADQVLEKYTGSEEELVIPMGVTKVKMEGVNLSVTSIQVPESVREIDYESVYRAFPNLKSFSMDESEGRESKYYSVKDGVLYDKNGNKLVMAPSANKIMVQDSPYDLELKSMLFQTANFESVTVGVEDSEGNEIKEKQGIYTYDKEKDVLVYTENPQTVAAVREDVEGEYTVPAGIKTIGAGAFMGCAEMDAVQIPESVYMLDDSSLVLPKNIKRIVLKGEEINISDHLFGEPQEDGSLPSVRIFVPEKVYKTYVETWSQILDPVYGDGAAEQILSYGELEYIYQDGAKYCLVKKLFGKETYILDSIVDKDINTLRVLPETTEIAENAFDGADKLEMIQLPDTIKTIGKDAFKGCQALETITCNGESAELIEEEMLPDGSEAEVLGTDEAFCEYIFDDGIIYGVKENGDKVIINVRTDYSGTLVLEENTTAIYPKAMKNCSSLEVVVLTDAVTRLEEETFYGCSSLRLLMKDSGNGLENITEIGDFAFADCVSLTEVTLPNVETLGKQAYAGCIAIEKVVISDEEKNSLTFMDNGCFKDCTKMIEIEINGSLEGISKYCFYGCRHLDQVRFSEKQKEKLQFIGAMAFGECIYLSKIDWRDMSLTALYPQAFKDCTSLEIVKLPETVSEIDTGAFDNCRKLSLLMLYNPQPVQIGDNLFGEKLPNYLNLWVQEESLDLYKEAYTEKLDDEYGEGTTEKILGVIDEQQEYINGVFYKITDEGKILLKASTDLTGGYQIAEGTTEIADEAFKDCTGLTQIAIGQGESVKLGDRCFEGCTSLEYAYLHCSIPEWGDDTFAGCTGLRQVQLGYLSTDYTERIGTRAFKGCTSLGLGMSSGMGVVLSGTGRIIGEEAFADCVNLQSIGYSTGISFRGSVKKIEDRAFKGCTSLVTFLTSGYTGLTYIGDYAFNDCDSMKQPAIPANVSHLGEGIFADCDQLAYVSFYGKNGLFTEIPKYCFKNCPNLIRTGGYHFSYVTKIGEGAYEGCSSLIQSSSWSIEKHTVLKEIGPNAFKGCTTLGDIALTGTITNIGPGAFDGCTGIANIRFKGNTSPTIGTMDLTSMAVGLTITVPDSTDAEDVVYLAYLESLTEAVGKEKAYQILDSLSDGAKERHPLPIGLEMEKENEYDY